MGRPRGKDYEVRGAVSVKKLCACSQRSVAKVGDFIAGLGQQLLLHAENGTEKGQIITPNPIISPDDPTREVGSVFGLAVFPKTDFEIGPTGEEFTASFVASDYEDQPTEWSFRPPPVHVWPKEYPPIEVPTLKPGPAKPGELPPGFTPRGPNPNNPPQPAIRIGPGGAVTGSAIGLGVAVVLLYQGKPQLMKVAGLTLVSLGVAIATAQKYTGGDCCNCAKINRLPQWKKQKKRTVTIRQRVG